MNLKTINMIAEEFLKQKLDMKSMPLSLTLKSDKLFALMEEYHEARMRELPCDHPFAFVHSRCFGEINHCLKCGKDLSDN